MFLLHYLFHLGSLVLVVVLIYSGLIYRVVTFLSVYPEYRNVDDISVCITLSNLTHQALQW